MFDWKFEYKQPQRDVYKLTIVNNQQILQGLISLEVKEDHVYMHLVESVPFNKGKAKMYMKTKSKELDVDFIGGQDIPLTKEEQFAISAFIKQLKEKQKKVSRNE